MQDAPRLKRFGVMVVCLCAGLITAGSAQQDTDAFRASFSLDPAAIQQPWPGVLDGMIARGSPRLVTVHSKTTYFAARGVLRETVVVFARLFEDGLNRRLAAGKLLKNKNLKVRIVFIP